MVITESDIAEASHPEVEAAIRVTISEYNERGRVFPHGQLRFVLIRRTDAEDLRTYRCVIWKYSCSFLPFHIHSFPNANFFPIWRLCS